jgi:hypothetical protein
VCQESTQGQLSELAVCSADQEMWLPVRNVSASYAGCLGDCQKRVRREKPTDERCYRIQNRL